MPDSPTWTAEVGGIPIHFGVGVLARLGEVARGLGATRALVVSDPGVRQAGHVDSALTVLEAAGVEAAVFAEVVENPTTEHVEAGRAVAARERVDFLVGLGGGSAMDCAKGINFLLTNGGRLEDYQGFGHAGKPLLPAIGVPTTAGTGSEAQSFAVIAAAETHRKMACGDRKARFAAVLLDPALAATAPRRVAAATGYDALSHAVESYVSTRATPVSRLFAREAWRLLAGSFERALAEPGDPAAQGEMLLGAHLAGAAVEGSMLGAAHAGANPLTAEYGTVHGQAIALLLPHVVRWNGAAAGERYRGLRGREGFANGDGAAAAEPAQAPAVVGALVERLLVLRAGAGLPQRLADCGVERGSLPALAAEGATQWTARYNPRPVQPADLLHLYEAAW